jgi:hypothetical protein
MTHAAFPDCAQHGGLRVALHGVKDIAAEALHEPGRRIGDHGGAQAVHRLRRLRCKHGFIDCRQTTQTLAQAAAKGGDGGAGANMAHRTILVASAAGRGCDVLNMRSSRMDQDRPWGITPETDPKDGDRPALQRRQDRQTMMR